MLDNRFISLHRRDIDIYELNKIKKKAQQELDKGQQTAVRAW